MDPIPSSETAIETESGLSRSQILRLEILKETLSDKHGTDADLLEIFLKSPYEEWSIFTLLYPKVAFHIDKIVDVVREVDKLFIDEYEIKLYGIVSSIVYVRDDRIKQWRHRFNDIIAAGPDSSLWDDTVWEFKQQAKKTGGGSLIAKMDSDLAELPEHISSKIELAISDIKIRFDFLDSRIVMIERCETEHKKESQELRRRTRNTYSNSFDSSSTEATSSSLSVIDEHLPETEEATFEAQSTAVDFSEPTLPSRTHSRRSQPVYPIFQATPNSITTGSLLLSKSTKTWQDFVPNWSFLGEKPTVLCLIPCLIVISAILIGIAITRTRSPTCIVSISNDDNFFTSVSQTIISLSSLYCTMIPFLRSREVPLNLFWFRVCLLFSATSGVASVVVYMFQWQSSVVFGFLCGIFQVLATFQLIEGIDATVA